MAILLHLQYKRAIKAIPRLFLGAILPILLAALALLYVRLSSVTKEPQALVSPVAIVNYDQKADLDFMLPYFSNVDATSGFRFVEMEENEAMTALSSGTICAVLVFPENMLAGIINSTNTPAKLYLPANSAAPSLLIGKFAEAGSRTLGAAQSAVYTAYDLYLSYDLKDYSDDINAAVNLATLHYALSREAMFSTRSVSATGSLSVVSYYAATLFLCLLLFLGSGMGGFLCNAVTPTLSNHLKQNGISVFWYEFSLFLPLFSLYLLLSGGLFLVLSKTLGPFPVNFVLLCFLFASSLCISLYTQLIFRLFRDAGRGLLVFLFCSFFLIFLAGGFLPYAFLPVLFQKMTPFLPLGAILTGLRHLCAGALSLKDTERVLLYCAVLLVLFLPANCLIRREAVQ